MLERYPQVVRWTRASGTTCGKGEVPSLGKGGVAAPSSKWSHSFEGAAGVVRSTSDNRWLEPTTPSAPAKEAPRHFLNGRAKEGNSGSFCFPRLLQIVWRDQDV